VRPAPVGVQHDGGALRGATALGAGLGGELGVILGLESAHLLSVDEGKEGERNKECPGEHS